MEEIKTEENKGNQAVYEIGFHIAPTVSEEKIPDEVSKIKKILERVEASIISSGDPEYTNLLYPISKQTEGKGKSFNTAYFGWIKFQLSENPSSVEKELRENQNIIRYILIGTVREDTFLPRAERIEIVSGEDGGKKERSAVRVEEKRDLTKDEEKKLDEAIEELV